MSSDEEEEPNPDEEEELLLDVIESVLEDGDVGDAAVKVNRNVFNKAKEEWLGGKIAAALNLLGDANMKAEAEKLKSLIVAYFGLETGMGSGKDIWNAVFKKDNISMTAFQIKRRAANWKQQKINFIKKEAERLFKAGFVAAATTYLRQINIDGLADKLLEEFNIVAKTTTKFASKVQKKGKLKKAWKKGVKGAKTVVKVAEKAKKGYEKMKPFLDEARKNYQSYND